MPPPERAGSGGGTRSSAPRLRGPTPLSRPLTLLPGRLPHRGARCRFRATRPPAPIPPSPSLPVPSSFPPPLPTFGPAPVSAQTFSETPPSASSQNNKGRGRRERTEGGRERERGRERESERHPGICSSGSWSGVLGHPAAAAAGAPNWHLVWEGGRGLGEAGAAGARALGGARNVRASVCGLPCWLCRTSV